MNYKHKTRIELIEELQELRQEYDSFKKSIAKDKKVITECKQAQEMLSVSEDHYRTLFNAIDEGCCIIEVIFDENGKPIDYRFLETNQSFEKQTGLINAQGRRMRELAPDHEDYWFEIYGKIAITGQPARFENRAEQLHRWYDVYAFRIGHPENRQVAILFNDIIERKRNEEALRESEELFRTVLNNAPITIFATDKTGVFTLHQGRALQQVGMQPGENVGKSAFDLFGSLAVIELSGKVTTGEDILHRVLEGETVTGITELKDVYFENQFTPQFDSQGQVSGMIGVATDITKRKRAEEGIKRSDYLREVILDNLPLITLVLKKNTREIVACNKLAVEAGAVIGKTCYETLTHCNHNCPFCKAPDLWETEKKQQVEAEYMGRYWEGLWVPFTDDLYIHYLMDITDRKLTVLELKKTHEQLKQLYLHQDELIENERTAISREIHDELGQSLSAIKIDLDWIKDNAGNEPDVKRKIKSMTEIVIDAIKIVQRISSDLRPGLLDDLGLVPAMEWYIQEFEKRTGIKCHFKSNDIQSSNERKNLTLYRILQEALTNVMRHANAKNVTIKLYPVEDSIIMEIIDDGTGIRQEKIKSNKSLGLIGIRERVKYYNGSLDIFSDNNTGTRLSIGIPYNS